MKVFEQINSSIVYNPFISFFLFVSLWFLRFQFAKLVLFLQFIARNGIFLTS